MYQDIVEIQAVWVQDFRELKLRGVGCQARITLQEQAVEVNSKHEITSIHGVHPVTIEQEGVLSHALFGGNSTDKLAETVQTVLGIAALSGNPGCPDLCRFNSNLAQLDPSLVTKNDSRIYRQNSTFIPKEGGLSPAFEDGLRLLWVYSMDSLQNKPHHHGPRAQMLLR